MTQTHDVVLVDGSSYLFRAFHALPKLMSTKGRHTGAIKGVISMIRKLQEDHPTSELAVVFDAKGKSFRNDIYAEYKANRASMPDDLREQIAPIHEIIRSMGLPLIIVDGVEADDVIGTLAIRSSEAGLGVLISTGDKDMAQLVSERIILVNTMTETEMDPDGVFEKFGVRPDQIIDYLALVGDTSDNIPGVPKCGPKTAVKWLATYDSLNGVMSRADEVKGKVGESLRGVLDQLPLSRELATIRLDVALTAEQLDLSSTEPDNTSLHHLFTEYEFKQWADELAAGEAAHSQPVDYSPITSLPELEEVTRQWQAAKTLAFTLIMSDDHYMVADIVGLAVSTDTSCARYVPVSSPEASLALENVLGAIKALSSSPGHVISYNAKRQRNILRRYGVMLPTETEDPMLASYVLNSVASKHQIDDLSLKYLGRHCTGYEDVVGKGTKKKAFAEIPLAGATDFACEQVDVALQLHSALSTRLADEPRLATVYQEIERPLSKVLSDLEFEGVCLDASLLERQSAELEDRMVEAQQDAYDIAGQVFNLDSPKQLQEILFDKLGLPIIRKTPKGQPSTAEPVLQELAMDYPLPRIIIDYRSLHKLKSTYTDQLPKQVNAATRRIHTTYRQAVAATGRLSSQDPNLQNIPIRNEEGRKVRQAFVAPPGHILVAADYSQIELRIMAHLSGDDGLVAAFSEGKDIHLATAAEVFGVPEADVHDYQRRSAKAINFGLIYGMSAFGLAQQLGVSRADAQEYIDLYFDRYPGVHGYMEQTRSLASEQGYVETLFGRRLYLPDINASNFQRRQAAERTAINAPMQGSAADIIKIAMLSVSDWLCEAQLTARMIMQVHDELVLEVSEEDADEVARRVSSSMESAAKLNVPLVVDVGRGSNWDVAH